MTGGEMIRVLASVSVSYYLKSLTRRQSDLFPGMVLKYSNA